MNKESTEAAVALYAAAIDTVVPVSSARVAESSKLLENIFRSINIALVNELKMTFDRMGIDIWEVIEAAKTKPFGFKPFYPGPGLGGHCIPLDPFYLSWKAAEYGIWTRFIELAGEINTHMPHYVVDEDGRRRSTKKGRASRARRSSCSACRTRKTSTTTGSRRRTRSSSCCGSAGRRWTTAIPYFPVARPGRKHDIQLKSMPCTAEAFAGYDAVVLSTGHKQFKEPSLYANVGLVVDTRNAVRLPEGGKGRLVKA